ncbi:Bax inhibitor-1/YccA family protein [Corynebacterium uterequi]|uniref:Putative membrane protein n=1 Tax=Corynebacterium uterequi TaxID=1072256 RepID=A0A0G3HFP1_9CORY|nr:Bax inhibitor-1/YccA family protein [Corynebacterium uterequi]AKK10763.1 putative membrane protein [Corynebacterium uterequi]
MRSNNPVLTKLRPQQASGGYYQGGHQGLDGFGGYGQPAPSAAQAERPMTVDDVVTKTGMTLAVIVVFALINFGLAKAGMVGLAVGLTAVGGIGGFITVLIATLGGKSGPVSTLIYAAFEGLLVGGISLLLSGWLVGGANAGALIGQAVLGTLGVFLGMLFVYKTGAIKVTPKFTRFLMGALIGVVVLSLGNMLLAMFTDANPLRDGGILAIIFSLVCIALAALSFLQDFDAADRLIRAGAPASMAWSVALGLAVTLVWLYTEILRFLSYFTQR